MEENKILYKIKSLEVSILRKIEEFIEIENTPPTFTQLRIMEYMLKNAQKDIYQKDLEDVLNLRRATVSGVLQTMEKNGLIVRSVSDNDARTKKVILNENTKKMFLNKFNYFEKIEEVITKDLTETELNNFLLVLEKMKNNIKDYKS